MEYLSKESKMETLQSLYALLQYHDLFWYCLYMIVILAIIIIVDITIKDH